MMKTTRKRRIVRLVVLVLPIFLVVFAGMVWAVFGLWNWLMPSIFGLRAITYWQALAEGFSAWPRLMLVRFVVIWVLLLPSLGWLVIYQAGPALRVVGSLALIGLTLLILALLVRFALVDSAVVLGGATPFNAWRQAAELTAGQRWSILWTAAVLFVLIFGVAIAGGQAFRTVPGANHFVARVLFDCVLAVAQSLFTIALFLFYWRKQGIPAPAEPART